jgi:beta-lactam-binding protein with PASTA domain
MVVVGWTFAEVAVVVVVVLAVVVLLEALAFSSAFSFLDVKVVNQEAEDFKEDDEEMEETARGALIVLKSNTEAPREREE